MAMSFEDVDVEAVAELSAEEVDEREGFEPVRVTTGRCRVRPDQLDARTVPSSGGGSSPDPSIHALNRP